MRIALVDDDPDIAELVSLWLEEAGHSCIHYVLGLDFIRAAKRESYDVVLLDWVMPSVDGAEILTYLKKQPDWDTPVIFITSRTSEDGMVKILEQGADDYITKPIRQRELLARIKAVKRRSQKTAAQSIIEIGSYRIDPAARTVSRVGKPIKLTEKEFKLVVFIFNNIGRLLSRNHILASVWGYDSEVNTRTIDTHMSRIRKKLELFPENGWRLNSIYHQGYRLERISSEQDPIEHA